MTKQSGEETGIVVTHLVADGLDALARGNQQVLRGFDAQALQVVQRLVPGGGLEAAHEVANAHAVVAGDVLQDRKSTRLNSSHVKISYAVFCLKKKKDGDVDMQFEN